MLMEFLFFRILFVLFNVAFGDLWSFCVGVGRRRFYFGRIRYRCRRFCGRSWYGFFFFGFFCVGVGVNGV